MGIQQISGASAPLTAADLRSVCSIDASDTSFDGDLTNLIAAANNRIEDMSGKAFGAQTWNLALDTFPDSIELPKGPVTAVAWIKYYDTTGTEQTLDASKYLVDLISNPARLVPVPGLSWPAAQTRPNAITVQFTSGYTTIPPKILQAIRTTVAAWFQTRETTDLPVGVAEMLDLRGGNWGFA
ncbi:MAG: hypothetical protein EBR82_17265 [Caulobacteraceae bacterium]|nr:hypothetical protein [Caulobacteraceae bacterium]